MIPAHVKLDLVKAADTDGLAFKCNEKFLPFNEVKIKEGVFVGCLITTLQRFRQSLRYVFTIKKNRFGMWQVAANFLENDKADNYREPLEDMLALFHEFW
ncbi:hypothetical protein Trydic_g11220 [Trypoxylus dichotomus]